MAKKIPRVFVGSEDLRVQLAFDKLRRWVGGALAALQHNDLQGRDDPNCHPASSISVDTSPFHQNLGPADDTVQKALVTLDTVGGGPSAGSSSFVRLPIPGAAGVITSAAVIPQGSTVVRVSLDIEQSYDGNALILVDLAGAPVVALMTTLQNNPSYASTYLTEPWHEVAIGGAGPVRCTVAGAPTMGAATLNVEYVASPLT